MKKRGEIKFAIAILALMIMLFHGVSASFSIDSDSIKKEYALTESLSGKLNLSIGSENYNSVVSFVLKNQSFSRNLANVSLISLLANQSYTCTPIDCKEGFSRSGSAETSKTLAISGNPVYFGFLITGPNVTINSIEFGVSPNFGENYIMPLGMKFFDSTEFRYSKLSGLYSDYENFGCFRGGGSSEFVSFPSGEEYCEKIFIFQTSSMKIGAKINGYDPVEKIKMAIYKDPDVEIASCNFDPEDSDSCIVNSADTEEKIFEGDYYVCAQTVSDQYKILMEAEGENCGGTKTSVSQGQFDADFSIFVKIAKYARGGNFTITSSTVTKPDYYNMAELVTDANTYLQEKYQGHCTSTCILPVKVYGVNQNLKISRVSVKYSERVGGIVKTLDRVSVINNQPPKISFSGEVPVDNLNLKLFYSGVKNITINFNGQKKLSKEIIVKPAPIINSVYPANPPVGVSSRFFAAVDSGNRTITSYKWDFGDGTTTTTTENNVLHKYTEMKSYNLRITVTDSLGLSGTREFTIVSGAPGSVINSSLRDARDNLNKVQLRANGFEEPYKTELNKLLELEAKRAELQKIENTVKLATLDEEFFKALTDISNLEIPYDLAIDVENTKIVPDADNINPSIISEVAGGTMDESDISSYQKGIATWEQANIESTINIKNIYSVSESGRKPLMSIYSLSLTTDFAGDNYIVLGENLDNIFFKNDGDLHFGKVLDSSVGSFLGEDNSSISLEFYTKQQSLNNVGNIFVFVSPSLDELSFENIEVGVCNYNKRCDKDLGENSSNCESDCFPYLKLLLYILLALLIGFIIYSTAAVWYTLYYERHLFKDRRNLFNLMAFIENARNKKVKEDDIKESLAKKGWNSEQIVYAIKKQKGERTGMLEIIPFSRLFDIKVKKQIIIPNSPNTTVIIKH